MENKDKTLYIMRGISGSGKSTFAKQIQSHEGGVIYSTDEFRYQNGKYVFDPEKNVEQHHANQKRAIEAMQAGITPIIIDNINVTLDQARPYIDAGLEYGYNIQLRQPTTDWQWDAKELAKRNDGRAPLDVIEQMLKSWEPNKVFYQYIRNKE